MNHVCTNTRLEFLSIVLLLILCSCQRNSKESAINDSNANTLYLSDLKALNKLHVPLREPKSGEWLYSQREPGQSFNEYIHSKPVYPYTDRNKIYIRPIGEFDNIDYTVLNTLREYISVFFGLETILLEVISDSIIPDQSRRMNDGIEQLHTKYILNNILIKSMPEDAIVYIAITSKDLYPQEDWNFVFGQAYLKKRTGVSSIYRFKYENEEIVDYTLYLNRIMKTATHELGHMFSLKHCIKYKCLMNGSICLSEADNKPSWLCPDCLAKIMWCTNYDIYERDDSLISFYHKYGNPEKEKFYRESK